MYFYDPSSVVHKPDHLTVWTLKESFEPLGSELSLWKVRCAEREYAIVQKVVYSGMTGSGNVVSSEKAESDAFFAAPPDTVADNLITQACSQVAL